MNSEADKKCLCDLMRISHPYKNRRETELRKQKHFLSALLPLDS